MLKGLALIFFIGSAFAADRTGEYIKYEMSYQGNAGVQISRVADYSRGDDLYKVVTEFTMMGQTNEEVEMVPSEEVMTHEGAAQTMTFCPLLSGTVEDLVINGKSYATCKVPVNDENLDINIPLPKELLGNGHVWLGDFPVNGVAQFKSADMSLTIKEFHWNN
ncbi:MAG: hypothetical protein KC493_10760 [Bacteriovoracaceae bacterium]|nr:hypothetical protein [Bacteriovoracaceae bacterium]